MDRARVRIIHPTFGATPRHCDPERPRKAEGYCEKRNGPQTRAKLPNRRQRLRTAERIRFVSDYLLPIADREPLAWIIAEQRTAVAAHRRAEAERLEPGDGILLYTTRGCFRNPTRDRGLVIGQADVVKPALVLHEPIRFRGREYPIGVDLRIRSLAPLRRGVELAPLVAQLEELPEQEGVVGPAPTSASADHGLRRRHPRRRPRPSFDQLREGRRIVCGVRAPA